MVLRMYFDQQFLVHTPTTILWFVEELARGKRYLYIQTQKIKVSLPFLWRKWVISDPLVKPLLSVFLSIPPSRSLEEKKRSLLPEYKVVNKSRVYFIFLSSTTQPTQPTNTPTQPIIPAPPHKLHLSAGPLDTKVWTTRRCARNSSRT